MTPSDDNLCLLPTITYCIKKGMPIDLTPKKQVSVEINRTYLKIS